ncbi:hypothetical protein LINPERPRIM_LOCUS16173 [Linum perenne]
MAGNHTHSPSPDTGSNLPAPTRRRNQSLLTPNVPCPIGGDHPFSHRKS